MLDVSVLKPLKNWGLNRVLGYCVGADVGASGIRFRISNPANQHEFVDIPKLLANNAKELYADIDVVHNAIKKVVPTAKCFGGAFAIGGLRKGDIIIPSNWNVPDPERTIETMKFPEGMYPKKAHYLLNDLEACAYGLVAMDQGAGSKKFFRKLWGPGDKVVGHGRTAVMALGSGLGAAVILKDPIIGQPYVMATEMGYLQIPTIYKAHENFDYERKIVQYLSDYWYDGATCPGYEDLASARAIRALHKYWVPSSDVDAATVSNLAKKGDKKAYAAMLQHYIYYTRLARAFALTMKCDSIVMALSNQVNNDYMIKDNTDKLKAEFFDGTRSDWIKDTTVWSQNTDYNFNLYGATYLAHLQMKNE